ncbi:MAG: hypothetical protein U0R44_05425 [Candidatus Micrarchaeia archaeon]
MERKITVPLYAGAFLLSLAIFVSGIYIGSAIDNTNLNNVAVDVSTISEKVASVQLLLLSEGNASSFCPVYSSELRSIDNEVEKVGYKLSFLEDEKGVYDNDLKRKYFLLEAESYLLSKKVRSLCGSSSILLINFYSNKDCARCREQGTEILKARDALAGSSDIKLFSFDGELDSPVAESFEKEYNITGYPSVVIDGKTYPGFHDSAQLQKLMSASK